MGNTTICHLTVQTGFLRSMVCPDDGRIRADERSTARGHLVGFVAISPEAMRTALVVFGILNRSPAWGRSADYRTGSSHVNDMGTPSVVRP